MNHAKYVIGFESTAHTFSAAVVKITGKKIEILSNVLDKFPPSKQGFIPRELADHHAAVFPIVLRTALNDAHVKLEEISAVAYSQGAGIGHSLHIGYVAATSIAIALRVPLVPVNHGIAHIEITRKDCATKNPLVLYVSGGNTQILTKQKDAYHVYGETLDMGVGNMLDNLGRLLELEIPDAVGVASEANKKGAKYVECPYSVKGMNVSFTGMLTYTEKKLVPLIKKKEITTSDVCFSIQETAFAMLCEITERALCHTDAKEIILCGGNARNKRLQQMLIAMSEAHGVKVVIPPFEYAGDNAAMITYTAAQMLIHKTKLPKDISPEQKMRTDDATVNW